MKRVVTLAELQSRFDMPLHKAADDLEVSTTYLKRICRKHGIANWPYRRLRSLKRKRAQVGKLIKCVEGTVPSSQPEYAPSVVQQKASHSSISSTSISGASTPNETSPVSGAQSGFRGPLLTDMGSASSLQYSDSQPLPRYSQQPPLYRMESASTVVQPMPLHARQSHQSHEMPSLHELRQSLFERSARSMQNPPMASMPQWNPMYNAPSYYSDAPVRSSSYMGESQMFGYRPY